MTDDENTDDEITPMSLAQSIRDKIAAGKAALGVDTPEKSTESDVDLKSPKQSKHCPSCSVDYLETNFVVCPRCRTILLQNPQFEESWYEQAGNGFRGNKRCPKCSARHAFYKKRCDHDNEELEVIEAEMIPPPLLEERFELLWFWGEDKLFESYLAKDLNENEMVFVNYLHEIAARDSKTVTRFLNLAKTAVGLSHPNLIKVHSVNVTIRPRHRGWQHLATPYMVSDYVISKSLQREIKARKCFSPASAARIFIDILGALSYAHERSIVHGAINTSNLRVAGGAGNRGIGLITNFGLAERLFKDMDWEGVSTETRTANLYGDPDGICPEFCKGQRPTAKTDQYQIGCTLYEALCGKPPFERPSSTQILFGHMSDEMDNILEKNKDVPPELVNVLKKCLEKNPDDRYPSLQAMSDDLQKFVKE